MASFGDVVLNESSSRAAEGSVSSTRFADQLQMQTLVGSTLDLGATRIHTPNAFITFGESVSKTAAIGATLDTIKQDMLLLKLPKKEDEENRLKFIESMRGGEGSEEDGFGPESGQTMILSFSFEKDAGRYCVVQYMIAVHPGEFFDHLGAKIVRYDYASLFYEVSFALAPTMIVSTHRKKGGLIGNGSSEVTVTYVPSHLSEEQLRGILAHNMPCFMSSANDLMKSIGNDIV